MEKVLLIVLLTIALGVCVLLIWNIRLYLGKKSRRNNSEEYIELKYQQQFHVAVFAMAIAVISFLGYDKYSDLEKSISEKFQDEMEQNLKSQYAKMDSLTRKQREIIFQNNLIDKNNHDLNNRVDKANEILYKMFYDFADVKNKLYNSERVVQNQIEKVKGFHNDIEQLKKIDFLNQVHLVTGRKLSEKAVITGVDTIYFNKIHTVTGEGLPTFNHSPSIILSKTTGMDLHVDQITDKYFVLVGGSITFPAFEGQEVKLSDIVYDLLIIYKDSY